MVADAASGLPTAVTVVPDAAATPSQQQLGEALLCDYERALLDPAVANQTPSGKRALSATYPGSERQMMRVLKRARLARESVLSA